MSDIESDDDNVNDKIDDSMKSIRSMVEQIAHNSKHIYSKAISLDQQIQNPEADIWARTFKIHDRARSWAKKNMVASKCSLWEINKTLMESAQKDKRISDKEVSLLALEAEIMNLPIGPVPIWKVLGRLPRFFI
jgi:hypothetical protein